MIKEITIRNYKSIHDLKLELGNVNVFIGENGCGKTNILEAVAMLSAAQLFSLDTNTLFSKGIRVARPSLTISSFLGKQAPKSIFLGAKYEDPVFDAESQLIPIDANDIFTTWKEDQASLELRLVESKFWEGEPGKKVKHFRDSIDELQKVDYESGEFVTSLRKAYEKVIETIREKLISNDGATLSKYQIFNPVTNALRGITSESRMQPLGINGEGLDLLLSDFSKEEWEELLGYRHLISWLEDIIIDQNDSLKYKGHKIGRSNSVLYFRDKFMRKNNNVFAAENSNEGVLHILFYLALFISRKTPKFFAIDNIESSLNPKLCRTIMKEIAALAVKHGKQALITTHNPAVLDGMNLFDDTQRLFVVSRSDEGHTKARRIQFKPEVEGKELKLSEMWMRGYLGALPDF